jgi:uncharacterized SAM-binding protein YcdF (DUF218 family)
MKSPRRDLSILAHGAMGKEGRSPRGVSAPARRWQHALVPLLILALVAGLVIWGLRDLGHWLVVADPLHPATAIVVLGGGIPFRAMEAAALYQQGWAPQVWVTRGTAPAAEAALTCLGIQVVGEEHYSRQVLERLGVLPEAIRILPEGVQNTMEEVQQIARELRRIGGDRVILVTSKPHTRRVRATWRALIGDAPQAAVRYAVEEPYHPTRWWREAGDALAVSREVFGLLNVWAGFPVRQESQ